MKAILMQNFGGTNKECYGIFESGLYLETPPNAYGLFLILTDTLRPNLLFGYSKLGKVIHFLFGKYFAFFF